MKRYLSMIILFTMIITAGCQSSSDTKEVTENNHDEVTLTGYIFETENAKICIGEEAQTATEQLGEPLSLNEAASCAFGDLDKIWTYNDFTIYSYQEDGVDYIYDIVLTSDAISTMEGICIGDTVDDVMGVYGEADEQDDTRAVYRKDDMKLLFILDNGNVRSIEYSTTMWE